MKKTIISAVLSIFIISSGFTPINGKGQKDSTSTSWRVSDTQPENTRKNDYKLSSLQIYGVHIQAYYNKVNNNVLYVRKIETEEIPQQIVNWKSAHFTKWTLKEASIAMNKEGEINYYTGLSKGRKYLVLKFNSLEPLSVERKSSYKTITKSAQ